MDTQPKIPTLKDSQKPQVKIRGLEAGVTLFDRLKQFKKKDLAFILAGLGTLFMAPLAEHFMMSPENGDGQLQQGWGGKGGGKGMFDGSGSSPYEPGTTGLAPGSAVGGGSDIITPLNVRDPSALVMGPGATQQPPTQSVMPATPPPTAVATRSDSDLKDALAASARGVGAAAHAAKALLPIPKIALAGSGGLRGLGVVSGGTSASAGGGGISSNGLVSGKAASGGGLGGVRSAPGYKGVARGQTGGGSGGLDALKAAAGNAADSFNNKGAYQGATDAANTGIPNGGGALGGGGAGGTGVTDKPFGGDQNKDGKSVGESLAFLKQKAIQDAQIALWSKEQEAGDNKLEALKIRNSMAEAFTSKIAGMAADQVGCMINNSSPNCPTSSAGVTAYYCTPGGPDKIPASAVGKDAAGCMSTPGGKDGAGAASAKIYFKRNGGLAKCSDQSQAYTSCTTDAADSSDGSKNPPPPNNVTGGDGLSTAQGSPNVTDLVSVCQAADTNIAQVNAMDPAAKRTQTGAVEFYNALKTQTQLLISARDALFKGASGECGAPAIPTQFGDSSYNSAIEAARKSKTGTAGATDKDASSAIAQMAAVVGQKNKELDARIPGAALLQTAEDDRKNAASIVQAASQKIEAEANPPLPAGWVAGSDAAKKAATYTDKLTGAKTDLRSFVASINDVVKENGSLDQQHKLLEKIVNPGEAPSPTLKTVVSVNVAEAKAEADFKAAAGGDKAPAITPADAQGDAPKGNYDGTTGAITTAKTSVGADDTAGARKAVADFKAAPDETKKTAAQTALGTASRDVSQMQTAQSGWLTDIGNTVRGINLPTKTP